MSESIYLQGSETVHDASCKMSNAASEMMRAANMVQDATHRLELLFGQGYGTNLDRLIEALEKKEAKP